VAVNDPTTNYTWDLPLEGGATDTWGTTINEMVGDAVTSTFEAIDYTLGKLQGELDAEELRITDLVERTEQLEAAAPRPAYARAYLATAESIARNVAEDLSWTEDFDKTDMFDSAAPTRMTIPSTYDGLYKVRGVVSVPFATGSDNNSPSWYARIIKNGATTMAESRLEMLNDNADNTGSGNETMIVEALVNAVGGDYFEIEVWYQDVDSTVATLNVEAGTTKTYFEIYRLRSPVVALPATIVFPPVYSTNASSTDNHSVTLPSPNRQAGDMLVFIFSPRANPALILEPVGYSQAGNSGAESAVHDHYVYYRRVTSSEAGGGTVTGWELSIARKSVAVAFLLRNVHATDAPEVDFAMGTGSANSDNDLTPSWGSDTTLWLHAISMDPSENPTAVPSGYTATDVEAPDPDYKRTGTLSSDAEIAACYKTAAGAQEVIAETDWTYSAGAADLGTLIAIHGEEVS
jgi:hypothetical protein